MFAKDGRLPWNWIINQLENLSQNVLSISKVSYYNILWYWKNYEMTQNKSEIRGSLGKGDIKMRFIFQNNTVPHVFREGKMRYTCGIFSKQCGKYASLLGYLAGLGLVQPGAHRFRWLTNIYLTDKLVVHADCRLRSIASSRPSCRRKGMFFSNFLNWGGGDGGYKIFDINGRGKRCSHFENFKRGTNLGDVFLAMLTKSKKFCWVNLFSYVLIPICYPVKAYFFSPGMHSKLWVYRNLKKWLCGWVPGYFTLFAPRGAFSNQGGHTNFFQVSHVICI